MTVRNIKKNLAGMQDLLIGKGVEVQNRADALYSINRIDVPFSVDTIAEMSALDISLVTRARVYRTETKFIDYVYIATDTTGIVSDTGAGSWFIPDNFVVHVDTVAEAVALDGLTIGAKVQAQDYATGNDAGVLNFEADPAGTGTADGGSRIDVPTSNVQLRQIFGDTVGTKQFGAKCDGITDDTLAVQNTLDYADTIKGFVMPSAGRCVISQITLGGSITGISGIYGANSSVFVHKPGATGTMIKWNGSIRLRDKYFANFYLEGNGEVGEDHGFDITGISYSSFYNVRARLFNKAGFYGNGIITPINSQVSNLTFVHCTGNNNTGDGILLEDSSGTGIANSALTFISCEFAGNANIGINIVSAYVCQFYGVTAQGNSVKDIYCNGIDNLFTGYVEGNAKSIHAGPASKRNEFKLRSSYPLWNTYIDDGIQNSISVNGETSGVQLYEDPYFYGFLSSKPSNFTTLGLTTYGSYSDTEGDWLELTDGVGTIDGVKILLNKSPADLAGKWVTLVLEMDTTQFIETGQIRVYTDVDGTTNSTNGEFAVETLKPNARQRFFYDVKFDDAAAGTNASITLYFSYTTTSGGNTIRLKSLHILEGQIAYKGNYQGKIPLNPISVVGTVLSDASAGINIHRKKIGRQVYNSSTGQLAFALSTSATSAWRQTNSAGDIVPS